VPSFSMWGKPATRLACGETGAGLAVSREIGCGELVCRVEVGPFVLVGPAEQRVDPCAEVGHFDFSNSMTGMGSRGAFVRAAATRSQWAGGFPVAHVREQNGDAQAYTGSSQPSRAQGRVLIGGLRVHPHIDVSRWLGSAAFRQSCVR
jgi:hypothetical protein